jgi:hypothetical protein
VSKPVILAAGSCLIHILGQGFHALCGNGERFDFVTSQDAPGGRPPVPGDVLARCVAVIEEASPWKKYHALSEDERSNLPGSCAAVRVPTIHFNSLWPLMVRDPRNVPEPDAPWGKLPFAFGDRLALAIRRTVDDPNRRLAAYFEADLHRSVNVKRNHELELSDMFAREGGCDVRIAAYVAANFRRRRLFYTHHHPTPELMTYALVQVLANPTVAGLFERSRTDAIDDAPAWVLERNPLFGEEAPIHPDVARFFNLEWYGDDMTYRWLDQSFTFERWIDFYLRYEPAALPGAVVSG